MSYKYCRGYRLLKFTEHVDNDRHKDVAWKALVGEDSPKEEQYFGWIQSVKKPRKGLFALWGKNLAGVLKNINSVRAIQFGEQIHEQCPQ